MLDRHGVRGKRVLDLVCGSGEVSLVAARLALREEMLTTVPSDWPESDAYGLGIEEVTSVMGPESTCGSAWGHLGFSLGHTTIALASEPEMATPFRK